MDLCTLLARVRARGQTALAHRVGIDMRALAVFRISLGLVLLSDLLLRSRDLVAFYTDSGVLPRSILREQFPNFSQLSIHTLSGAAWFQGLMFVVAGIFAVLVLVGYRTRFATAISLVLLVSLHARNPVLLNAGDSLLRRLLLWGVFLPLGGRLSVDALHDDKRQNRVVSLASAGLLLQVVVIYTVNALFKLRGDLWVRGVAVQYVFSLDHLTVFLGDFFARFPALLELFDTIWLMLVASSVLLLLLTGWSRAVFASLFIGMHLGMLLTMRLGPFPLVSITALIPFLPGIVWDSTMGVADQVTDDFDTARIRGRVDMLPAFRPFEIPRQITQLTARTVPIVLAGLIVFVLVWNAATLGYVETPPEVKSAVDPGEHRWSMFAPEPRTTDGWYVVPGRLESGKRTDAFHQRTIRWRQPPDVAQGFPSHRWLVYLLDLQRDGYEGLRPSFAEHVCNRWNSNHEDELTELSVYYVEQPTRLHGPEPTNRIELVQYSCISGDTIE
ncbi:HTTM domain-containing protein [Haladaptatus caseinilyticus]|uniref:HTTM domain-containing protein n=1 Tax=Haladaptatus caseinilyticus TaxID=2993314 RepID=UPI00224AA63B|nr:HTTM domain-containing protein [Haladaptatus caseinilyticus]